MVFVPPSPWKSATTLSIVVAVIITAALGAAFVMVVRLAYADANRPVSREESERFWNNLERRYRQGTTAGTENQASQAVAPKVGEHGR